MKIAAKSVVTIDYILTDDDGEIIDSSEGQEPLVYLHGSGQIVPGLENALLGKAKGDKITVAVPPAEGYGEHDEDLIVEVPRSQFPADVEIEVGMAFRAGSPGGEAVVHVVEISDDVVTIDANPPLAGETLNFAVTIVDVRAATKDELAHGHAHGPGGHHHH